MTTIQAKKLTLEDVHRLLNLVEKYEEVSFSKFFSLLPVSESEKTELLQIRNDFRSYLRERKAFLGQIKAITLFPLLRLAGFYHYPMQIQVEEGIENIVIEDEETIITGRLDIVLVNKEKPTINNIPFWILVIEAKESAIEVRQGLPQLLTYAYSSLAQQSVVWGLVTNGLQYLFVRVCLGNPSKYQLMPILDLMYTTSAIELLQVLKAVSQQ
ncbi:restriction endonuclease subunit R [Aphanothece hegewaldii CCALA 016]|uniref:Restriction endonuclease subunit R n=1 Tax=Aphanothece hegewaldii CCALA 016 TaxID=2107694 RepID=A0A2T1LV24_9CHRO|nr:restriction endonuclease subunit R [Aphanothece hegewaldii]PSF35533.1 restriction endonuclease subunit R [Aphanothece hegewaldii CCALA 016]